MSKREVGVVLVGLAVGIVIGAVLGLNFPM